MFKWLKELFRKSAPKEKRVPRVYYTGGTWGAHIKWWNPEEFKHPEKYKSFRCWGHQQILPQVGDILIGYFKHSVITFEFVKVEPEVNPPDMFFADVKPIKQEPKESIP